MTDDRTNTGSNGRDRLLTPGEVATLFRVDPKTVTRWASAGRIGSIRTPGGHRRFRESEVRALLRGTDNADVHVPVQPTVATAPLAGRPLVR
ncbi:MAG: BldC family transcriptional regulator [Actinobacteria bacterium]|nr:BldC family transcriptional regulator [Actinomycetota bacterium]MCA1719741.1 BldC family transcriptional regulator [Actinomycetota bacterium]